METYNLLEQISKGLHQQPRDADARWRYCWSRSAELFEALLRDLEPLTQHRGYVERCDWRLEMSKNFSSGRASLTLYFELDRVPRHPWNRMEVMCTCFVGPEVSVELAVFPQDSQLHLPRAFRFLAGANYDYPKIELSTLLQR